MDDRSHESLRQRLNTATGMAAESDWAEVERLARSIGSRGARTARLPAADAPIPPARSMLRSAGLGWRRRVVATWLVVLIAATGVAAAAIGLSAGSSPPVRLPGGTGLCPLGYPYAAEADRKLVYPPNYPGRALTNAHVTSCFDSAQDARAGGYRIPPPPDGDTTLGPLYLAPSPATVRRTCDAAQRFTHATVYCPTRLPAGWTTDNVGDPDCPTAGCAAPLLSISGSFMDPGDATIGSGVGESSASIWAASAWQLRHYPVPLGCGAAAPNAHARTVGRTTFRGHAATWRQCPAGGPLILEWHIANESYGISANGPAALRRRLIEYIAAHLIATRTTA